MNSGSSTVIGCRYRLVREIEKGNMGSVFLANDLFQEYQAVAIAFGDKSQNAFGSGKFPGILKIDFKAAIAATENQRRHLRGAGIFGSRMPSGNRQRERSGGDQ